MIGHHLTMIVISMISGLFSGMWIWADKFSDIRVSLNDVYMATLMTALMIFFMAALYKDTVWIIGSLLAICATVWLIRSQRFVTKKQYFQGMIPHHSMAVQMSKRLLENDKTLTSTEKQFISNIVKTQDQEIMFMKNQLSGTP